MKQTTQGSFYKTKLERIHYFKMNVDGTLEPQSIKLEYEVLTNEPNIQGTFDIQRWIESMLRNKIVATPDFNVDSELTRQIKDIMKNDDPFLFMLETTKKYITKGLFLILTNLLNEYEIELISLKYGH